jgi:hypothetical protein
LTTNRVGEESAGSTVPPGSTLDGTPTNNTAGRRRRPTGPAWAAFLKRASRELREIEALMLANDEALLQARPFASFPCAFLDVEKPARN